MPGGAISRDGVVLVMRQRVAPPLEGSGFDVAWHALKRDDRRRISRAVRRGEQLDDSVDAAFAVCLARQRQSSARLWALAVLAGLYAVQFGAALANGHLRLALLHGTLFAAVAALAPVAQRERRRARESERRNLQVLQERPVAPGTPGPIRGTSARAGGP